MSIAQTILHLELGRFLCGLGAGVSVVVVPLYLNEISPVAQRGQFGFMSQLAINLGILLAQTCGLFFSDYGDWRYIFAIGAGLAALNAILVLATPESPKWLATAWNTSAIQTRLTMSLSPISSRSVALKKKLYSQLQSVTMKITVTLTPRPPLACPVAAPNPSPFGSLAPHVGSAGNWCQL